MLSFVRPVSHCGSIFKLKKNCALFFSAAPSENFWPSRFKKEPYLFVCIMGHIVLSFQDGLRRRMDKLKSSIEEANQAVDRERQKNVSLLHLIFPPDIAKRLWLGQYPPLNLYLTDTEHVLCTTFSPSHK